MTNNDLNLKYQEEQRAIAAANQNAAIARIVHIIYYAFGVLEFLLAIRVILRAIGVNPDNFFASLIYNLSYPFAVIFTTLFANPAIGRTGVLEFTTIIGMI